MRSIIGDTLCFALIGALLGALFVGYMVNPTINYSVDALGPIVTLAMWVTSGGVLGGIAGAVLGWGLGKTIRARRESKTGARDKK